MMSVMKPLKAVLLFSAALFLVPSLTLAQQYTETILVSNAGEGGLPDSDLQNPWGLVSSPTSPWWISNNAGGTTTLYSIDSTGAMATKLAPASGV